MPSFHHLIFALVFGGLLADVTLVAAQPLKRDPTPQDYVERNGGGATIVLPGEFVLDGHRISCGKWATILDPNLNDYAASYPQFVILNMRREQGRLPCRPTRPRCWLVGRERNGASVQVHQHRATRCRPRRRCRPLQSDAPLLSGGRVREA
jgi:hypothetical protein